MILCNDFFLCSDHWGFASGGCVCSEPEWGWQAAGIYSAHIGSPRNTFILWIYSSKTFPTFYTVLWRPQHCLKKLHLPLSQSYWRRDSPEVITAFGQSQHSRHDILHPCSSTHLSWQVSTILWRPVHTKNNNYKDNCKDNNIRNCCYSCGVNSAVLINLEWFLKPYLYRHCYS